MACNLTQNVTLDCLNGVGGIKSIWVTELANKNTLSATAGVIDTFTLDSGKQFWKYDFEKETGNFTLNQQTSDANGSTFEEQTLNVMLNKGSATLRNELLLLGNNRTMIIVLDRNGVYWLLGQDNGMILTSRNHESGTAMGDRNGYVMAFVGKEETPAQTVDSTLISTLEAPAS